LAAKITSAYFDDAVLRSSSIGGLVMPTGGSKTASGAAVMSWDTVTISLSWLCTATTAACGESLNEECARTAEPERRAPGAEKPAAASGWRTIPAPTAGRSISEKRRGDLRDGLVHVDVDDLLVEFADRVHLGAGRFQPALDVLLRFRAAAGEPLHENLPAGRGEEKQVRLRGCFPDRTGAGEVDLDQHRASGRQGLLHRLAGSARPLQATMD